jgi:acyl-coenzyme A synthetase/AMP-(fatty) acid ligase
MMAAVRPRKSAFTGAILVADVVLAQALPAGVSPEEMSALILADLRGKLEPYKIPASLRFVSDLQTSSNGKLERRFG